MKTDFRREIAALATIRDELKVKAHLAKSDLRDELQLLESKWVRVEEELKRTKTQAQQDVLAMTNNVKELLLDLKQGYEGVKRRLG